MFISHFQCLVFFIFIFSFKFNREKNSPVTFTIKIRNVFKFIPYKKSTLKTDNEFYMNEKLINFYQLFVVAFSYKVTRAKVHFKLQPLLFNILREIILNQLIVIEEAYRKRKLNNIYL